MKPTILQEIFEAKKLRVAKRQQESDVPGLVAAAYDARASRERNRLRTALSGDGINIIAEFKRASPSKGIINDTLNAADVGRIYETAGASAISVLTEEDYFKGSIDDLRAMRGAVRIPVLQKDFVFSEFQIYEAAIAGADAILLIVAMLDDVTLRNLHGIAGDLGIDALVEVHNKEEMSRAAAIGAGIIGVNNRDLKTFKVSLDISYDLMEDAPAGAIMVTESGLKTRDDIQSLKRCGYDGFLIGETLMRSGDPEEALKALNRITKVKICGITNFEDADFAVRAGADALGFNFYSGSPRKIEIQNAAKIAGRLPAGILKVGVFVNEDIETVLRIASLVGLDAIQLHGDELPRYVDSLRKNTSAEIIKAMRVSKDFRPEDAQAFHLDTILLDAYSAEGYGGTGETFDWEIARQVRDLIPNMYLAGGLSVDNIEEAVRRVRPHGVDACSSLEREAGVKNNLKVDKFIGLAKGV